MQDEQFQHIEAAAESFKHAFRFEEALELYEAALSLRMSPLALFGKARALQQLGAFSRTLLQNGFLHSLFHLHRYVVVFWIAAVSNRLIHFRSYNSAGRYQESLDAYEVFLQLIPNDSVAKLNTGAVLFLMGNMQVRAAQAGEL